MLVHWIWFAHRPGLSDRMKLELLEHFQEPEKGKVGPVGDHKPLKTLESILLKGEFALGISAS